MPSSQLRIRRPMLLARPFILAIIILQDVYSQPPYGKPYMVYELMMPTTPSPTTRTTQSTTTTTRTTAKTTPAPQNAMPSYGYYVYEQPLTPAPAPARPTTTRLTSTTRRAPLVPTLQPTYYYNYYDPQDVVMAPPATTRPPAITTRQSSTPTYNYNFAGSPVNMMNQPGYSNYGQYSGFDGDNSMQVGPYFGPASVSLQAPVRRYGFPFSSMFFNPMDSRNLFLELG